MGSRCEGDTCGLRIGRLHECEHFAHRDATVGRGVQERENGAMGTDGRLALSQYEYVPLLGVGRHRLTSCCSLFHLRYDRESCGQRPSRSQASWLCCSGKRKRCCCCIVPVVARCWMKLMLFYSVYGHRSCWMREGPRFDGFARQLQNRSSPDESWCPCRFAATKCVSKSGLIKRVAQFLRT